jgi:diguanylate cyclase (GGDEF)-like protein
MISLKRYLDFDAQATNLGKPDGKMISEVPDMLSAYRSSLSGMGECGLDACPSMGPDLVRGLERVLDAVGFNPTQDAIEASEKAVRTLLRDWGKNAARHYEQRATEVKDLLLVISRTAESLGSKDDQYVRQLDAVTSQLESVANLEDLSRIRASVENSARELKKSIERMTAEGKAVINHLRVEVATYQAKLEKAEHQASCDPLTSLGTRRWVENRIQQRIENQSLFSIVLIDLNEFHRVINDYGNLVGDRLLKEFGRELRSSCRFTDIVGRWGGDEFIMVLDNAGQEMRAQVARMQSWISKPYHVPGKTGFVNVRLSTSIGVAEYQPGEHLMDLFERADSELCRQKTLATEEKTA